MANQEHLDILKQGVTIWNQWRQEHLEIQPDLTALDLSDANLSEADLTGVGFTDQEKVIEPAEREARELENR